MDRAVARTLARMANFVAYGPADNLGFSTWTNHTLHGGARLRCTCGLDVAWTRKNNTAREHGKAHAEEHATVTTGAAYFDTIGPTPDALFH